MRQKQNTLVFGVGNIVFSKDGGKVQATLEVGKKDGDEWVVERKVFRLLTENCPDYLTEKGRYAVRLDNKPGKSRKILSVYPADGRFVGTFDSFVAREGEAPAPQIFQSAFQAGDTYGKFTALIQIEGSEMLVPVRLAYNFEPYESDDGRVLTQYSKTISRSEPTRDLHNFLTAVGVADKDVPYKDNILPHIQKLAKELGKKFEFTLVDGRISSFGEYEEAAEDWSDDVSDDDPPWDGDEETESSDTFADDEIWE